MFCEGCVKCWKNSSACAHCYACRIGEVLRARATGAHLRRRGEIAEVESARRARAVGSVQVVDRLRDAATLVGESVRVWQLRGAIEQYT